MNTSHRLEQVTLPGLSFKNRQRAYIKCLGPIVESKRVGEAQDGRKAAHVMKVMNLKDKLMYRMICPALMLSAFDDEGEEYVGKCYEIYVSRNKVRGKDYKDVHVWEISPDMDYSGYPETEDEEFEKYDTPIEV